jgi:Arc/MetJ-type ribon-helix-helix transcriptional regulator
MTPDQGSINMKAMTLRLPAETAAELEAVARADETSVSEAVRDAIERHIAERRKDAQFKARLRKIIEDDREVLERLAK